ncbi:MAG: ribosome small subunit-dependent GTPase A [Lachnospiraceae bacterium]
MIKYGHIIRGVGGFYYVHDGVSSVYECRAKGVFRSKKIKPLVGDQVRIEIIDETEKTGNIIEIMPRSMEMIRPACANVDQALIVFAVKDPDPNYILLDKYLIYMEQRHLPVVLCFNKTDLAGQAFLDQLREDYSGACRVHFLSIAKGEGIEEMREILRGRITVLAGPSGAGKSSFQNYFCPDSIMETGHVSRKIGRGRHTTRHAELFCIEEDTYLMDTPGFSSMDLFDLEYRDLRYYYPEFEPYEGTCRFQGCLHAAEPDCKVKEAATAGIIPKRRYESYLYLLDQLKNIRRY